jgi:hypothetical protein
MIIEGSKNAHTENVDFVNADGSINDILINLLFQQLGSFDTVIGSRWIKGSAGPHPPRATRAFEKRNCRYI